MGPNHLIWYWLEFVAVKTRNKMFIYNITNDIIIGGIISTITGFCCKPVGSQKYGILSLNVMCATLHVLPYVCY